MFIPEKGRCTLQGHCEGFLNRDDFKRASSESELRMPCIEGLVGPVREATIGVKVKGGHGFYIFCHVYS